MAVLAGDIGGTKAWLAAFDGRGNNLLADKIYPSRDFDSLAAIVQQFRQDCGLNEFSAACFGLPGPVLDNRASLTNLPWQLCASQLREQLGISSVVLINDFQAAAMGIDALQQHDLLSLQQGQPQADGNRLVVGAGTGLGVAPVVRSGLEFLPQASEGGHMDFAPTSQLQYRLLEWMWQKWPHVSYERLLSGAGLQCLYAFFAGLELARSCDWPQPARIQQLADSGEEHAVAALITFVQIYGAYIGNAALLWPSFAGIYIAGGIAVKIQPWLRRREFTEAMLAKGRMQGLLEKMPVYLVREPALGLRGAMLCAKKL